MRKLVVHSEAIPALKYGTKSSKSFGSSHQNIVIKQQNKDPQTNRHKYAQHNFSLESSVFDFWKK